MTSQLDQLTADQAQLAAGRDLANWATMVRRLQVSEVPDGVDNINVDGPPSGRRHPGLRAAVAKDLPDPP
jgi:hypothetical protein